MKNILLLIAVLFSFTAKAQTNIYHLFPDSNAVWNEYNLAPWGCPYYIDFQENYSYTISGDTIIGGNQYHKLIIPYIEKNCNVLYHFLGYAGAIRQDTSMRKIFLVTPGNNIENLLYDFNLKIGDTVTGYLVNSFFCYQNDIVITAIDSVFINGNYRKIWITSTYAIFIEGIGNATGLLKQICNEIDGPISRLTCFKQNGIPIFPDSATQCDIIDEIKDISGESIFFSISPNPIHSTSLLHVSSEFENAELKIYTFLGSLVREERLSKQKSFELNRNELNNGIYLLQLINERGQMTTEKIVVE